MKKITILLLSLFTLGVFAQDTIAVWPNGAPNKNNPPGEETYCFERGTWRYKNVSQADLFVYHPEESKNTGAAVIICPGGGYWIEAVERSGKNIAKYLQSQGITGIVLKYRLPYGKAEVPSSDVQRAIRLVRYQANEWGIDPAKIGIAGGSAGGHLAAFATVHYDAGNPDTTDLVERMSCRPDFSLLLYPVISFKEHLGESTVTCRQRFMGDQSDDWEAVKYYCSELWVTPDTPPSFMVLSDNDDVILPEHSILYYSALKANNVPAEMHIFATGGHGYGLQDGLDFRAAKWNEIFVGWLRETGVIE